MWLQLSQQALPVGKISLISQLSLLEHHNEIKWRIIKRNASQMFLPKKYPSNLTLHIHLGLFLFLLSETKLIDSIMFHEI